jgi:hypothetical protein
MMKPYAIIDGERRSALTRDELVTYLGTCQIHAMVVDRSDDMVMVELICSGGCETIRVSAEQLRELRDILPESFGRLLEKYGV